MGNPVGAELIRGTCPSGGMQDEVGGESGVPAPSHKMPRLSEFPRNQTFSNVNARLSALDELVTECAYHASLTRRYWGPDEVVMLVIAIFGYLLGAWDLGIGELSSGGDYNRWGIFGQDSGFLHMEDLALILSLISIVCWIAIIVMLWLRYPIMRENMVYLLIGVVFVQVGYLKAHAESPVFPYGAGAIQWAWVVTVNLVLLFLAVFVVHRAVLETRDIHVQERHSHPDPRVFERAWYDHSLKAWSAGLVVWMVLLNISSWSGSHAISPSPGDLDLSYLLVGTYALTGILSMVVFLNILWFPQFMLGGAGNKHLYHNSTLALDADTGEIVWYYQHLNDHWDLDHPFERLLVDTVVQPNPAVVSWINPRLRPGEERRVITGIPGKTGVVYTLDRVTGEFLWATPTVAQNVISHIDGATGVVSENAEVVFGGFGQEVLTCPTAMGGKDWEAGAYSPRTNAMYMPLRNACARMAALDDGRRSLYSLSMRNELAPGTDQLGAVWAISAETGETLWTYEQRTATMSLVSTGGGLVFVGDVNGRFRALDDETGDVLWEINLGSPVSGFPVTYAVDGRQYVVAGTGTGGNASRWSAMTPEIQPSGGNNIFVFALPE